MGEHGRTKELQFKGTWIYVYTTGVHKPHLWRAHYIVRALNHILPACLVPRRGGANAFESSWCAWTAKMLHTRVRRR